MASRHAPGLPGTPWLEYVVAYTAMKWPQQALRPVLCALAFSTHR